MFQVHTILLPTDFSEPCEHAFRLACSLAREQGARLIVLHVLPLIRPVRSGRGSGEQWQPIRSRELVLKQLHSLHSPNPAVLLEHLLVEGDPAAEILRVAKEMGSDLIVMGLHGRTGLERVITGSVVEQVLRNAPCVVSLLKIPRPCLY